MTIFGGCNTWNCVLSIFKQHFDSFVTINTINIYNMVKLFFFGFFFSVTFDVLSVMILKQKLSILYKSTGMLTPLYVLEMVVASRDITLTILRWPIKVKLSKQKATTKQREKGKENNSNFHAQKLSDREKNVKKTKRCKKEKRIIEKIGLTIQREKERERVRKNTIHQT